MDGTRIGRALRRTVGALLTVVLLVAAAGYYVYSPRRLESLAPDGRATSAEPVPDRTPTPSVAATRTGTPTPTRTPSVGGADSDLPPGPGGRKPGIRLTARVLANGSIQVTETVRLVEAATTLALVPFDPTRAGTELRRVRPVATELVVLADGRPVDLPSRTVRESTSVRLPVVAERFVLRYRLRGVTVLSVPSPVPGRALGVLAPLTTGVPDDLPVAIDLPGARVRNVRCPGLPMALQSCFAGPRPHVRVSRALARRDALVVLQLNLRTGRR